MRKKSFTILRWGGFIFFFVLMCISAYINAYPIGFHICAALCCLWFIWGHFSINYFE